jgi:two-component system, chemotaxis family, CheB/CheR fusion protein
MASTAIATVFLDRDLRITRFTPAAVSIFNLIASDVGRPLSDLGHRLDYSEMWTDAQHVLQSLVPVEREVGESGGRSYLARLLPYRTPDDRIGGVVLNFVDITERRRTEEALRSSDERMRLVIESAKDYAIFTTDTDRRVDRWNSGAQTMFGYSEQEILGQLADVLFVPEDLARGEHLQEVRKADENGRAANERWHIRKDRSLFYGSGTVTPLRDTSGRLLGFLKIMRDLTASKQSEEALREHVDELSRFNQATEGRELRMIELKREINELCGKLGLPPSHSLDFETDKGGPTGP